MAPRSGAGRGRIGAAPLLLRPASQRAKAARSCASWELHPRLERVIVGPVHAVEIGGDERQRQEGRRDCGVDAADAGPGLVEVPARDGANRAQQYAQRRAIAAGYDVVARDAMFQHQVGRHEHLPPRRVPGQRAQ